MPLVERIFLVPLQNINGTILKCHEYMPMINRISGFSTSTCFTRLSLIFCGLQYHTFVCSLKGIHLSTSTFPSAEPFRSVSPQKIKYCTPSLNSFTRFATDCIGPPARKAGRNHGIVMKIFFEATDYTDLQVFPAQ